MELFFGTLVIVLVCCCALAFGVVITGKPVPGSCGKRAPRVDDCAGCPGREHTKACKRGL